LTTGSGQRQGRNNSGARVTLPLLFKIVVPTISKELDDQSSRTPRTPNDILLSLSCCSRLPSFVPTRSQSTGQTPNRFLPGSWPDPQESTPGQPPISVIFLVPDASLFFLVPFPVLSVPFFGQEGGIHRGLIVLKGLPKSLPRHSPSGPRENHGSKTVGEAVFRLSVSLVSLVFWFSQLPQTSKE